MLKRLDATLDDPAELPATVIPVIFHSSEGAVAIRIKVDDRKCLQKDSRSNLVL